MITDQQIKDFLLFIEDVIGIEAETLLGRSQNRLEKHTEGRALVWLVLYERHNTTLSQLGIVFNNRDHSTIRRGIGYIAGLTETDMETAKMAARLIELANIFFNQ